MSSTILNVTEIEGSLRGDGAISVSPKRFYRPELDALRFFAFLAVFIHHGIYNLLPLVSRCGAYGLSLFFFLSAFLITELLQREKQIAGKIRINQFYIRRVLRIWPLYVGFLIFTTILAIAIPSYKAPFGMMMCFLFLIGNFYVGSYGFPNNPASFLWSISVEEQFYLFWPLLNQICSLRTLKIIAIAMIALGSVMVLILGSLGYSTTIGIWTNSLVEFQFFGLGILVCFFLAGRVPNLSPGTRAGLLIAGAAFWLAAGQWTGINAFGHQSVIGPALGYYLVGLGCISIFFSVYGFAVKRLPGWLVHLGKISYGLYVFHELCLELAEYLVKRAQAQMRIENHITFGVAHIVLGFAFTVLLALISYRYFESPFLLLKEKFAVIRSRTV